MSSPPADKHQPTILLVEDDETTRDAMAAVLVREGYLVLTAGSGHDAISILHAPLSTIDVILLDVHLPDINGTDLCARVRQLQPDIPVIVCSGEAEPLEVAELLRLGVRRYFQKPMAIDELLATVEANLR
jgi:DNA-binding response OmpR family regulator